MCSSVRRSTPFAGVSGRIQWARMEGDLTADEKAEYASLLGRERELLAAR